MMRDVTRPATRKAAELTTAHEARRQLIEAEASTMNALAAARHLINVLEEENRELRQARAQADIYTEKEFADLFKVSEQTIQRLRLSGKIKALYVGTQPRYSRAEHFDRAAEIFSKRPRSAAA